MAKLTFKMDDTLKSIIEHARAAKKYAAPYGGKPSPALMFVKDEGIYLMSAGVPGYHKEDGKPSHVVTYANGCSPDAPESWEHCRSLVGGDDFSEHLPLVWFTSALDKGATSIALYVGSDQITFKAILPKSRVVSAVTGESVSAGHAAKQFAAFDAWKAQQT